MAPPLAGKPPFATEDPDSHFDSSPSPTKRRVPPPKPDNPNKRSSAYDVYDNYLSPGDNQASSSNNNLRPTSTVSTASRNSGIGALGMGLLAMDSDDDDDSDDEEAFERRRKAERERAKKEQDAKATATQQHSKNAALAAAIANNRHSPASPPASPPPSQQQQQSSRTTPVPPPQQRSPPPIAAPQPGYAAQISALNSGLGNTSPSPSENPFEPQQQQYQQRQPNGLNAPPSNPFQQPSPPPPPHLRNPPGLGGPQNAVRGGPPPMMQQGQGQGQHGQQQHGQQQQQPRAPPGINMNMRPGGPPNPILVPPPNAMVRGMTPAPLALPSTPIIPVFAVGPRSASGDDHSSNGHGSKEDGKNIKWDDLPAPTPRKQIMRSNSEDALLPSRGEKGDDFWRRFSMIAKVEMSNTDGKGGKKESMWLRKTTNGKNTLSRRVWVIGVILLLMIGGAIGCGVYFTRGDPDHQAPVTLGGGAGKAGVVTTEAPASSVGGKATGKGAVASSTVLHVSPTHTIGARGVGEEVVVPTPYVVKAREHKQQQHQMRKRRF